mmetsp:Transcript_6364/g.20375  ORF Transcript_6364/g.20375 Transcript_6364/m.20375 type:complete len:217 (-) Transcript_6364:10-660(-)
MRSCSRRSSLRCWPKSTTIWATAPSTTRPSARPSTATSRPPASSCTAGSKRSATSSGKPGAGGDGRAGRRGRSLESALAGAQLQPAVAAVGRVPPRRGVVRLYLPNLAVGRPRLPVAVRGPGQSGSSTVGHPRAWGCRLSAALCPSSESHSSLHPRRRHHNARGGSSEATWRVDRQSAHSAVLACLLRWALRSRFFAYRVGLYVAGRRCRRVVLLT